MPKAYTTVVCNQFFGNNSSKPEPIRVKFYWEMSTHVARSLFTCKLLTPSTKQVQNDGENCTSGPFGHQNNTSFHPHPDDHFPRNLNSKHKLVSPWFFGIRIVQFFR